LNLKFFEIDFDFPPPAIYIQKIMLILDIWKFLGFSGYPRAPVFVKKAVF